MNVENKSIISNWNTFKELLLSTKRKGIIELIDWLDKSDFKVAPASTRYHSNHEGGLLEHSLNVYRESIRQKDLIDLFKVPIDSIIITSLLHDICKTNYYKMDVRNVKKNGAWVQEPFYSVDDFFPIGHAEKSIIILQQFIQLNEVEIAMIRNHMGFSKDEPSQVSELFNKYPEAIIIHNADIISTFVIESPGMLEDFKEGLIKYTRIE